MGIPNGHKSYQFFPFPGPPKIPKLRFLVLKYRYNLANLFESAAPFAV
jgi:hypothetical protein